MNRYAISDLSLMPLREEASHKSEMISQVLYGELLTIIDTYNDEWFYIELAYDKYKGWVSHPYLTFLDASVYNKQLMEPCYYSLEIHGKAMSLNKSFFIPYGSRLPGYDGKKFYRNDDGFEFKGAVCKSIDKKSREFIIKEGLKFLETPYLWGGKSSYGIDCSGFVQNLFKVYGCIMPRDAYQQFDLGTAVDVEDMQACDLAFFTNKDGRIVHVGIIIEKGKILHASGKVRIDEIDDKGVFNHDLNHYTHQLKGIKRIL